MLTSVPDRRDNIVLGAGHDHAQRVDLVQACVVRVRGSIQGLEVKLPVDDSSQVIVYSSAALIHGSRCTFRGRAVVWAVFFTLVAGRAFSASVTPEGSTTG